jgi:hypothetical protein
MRNVGKGILFVIMGFCFGGGLLAGPGAFLLSVNVQLLYSDAEGDGEIQIGLHVDTFVAIL